MARKVVLVDYLVYSLPLSVCYGGAKICLGEHHPKVSWCFFFHFRLFKEGLRSDSVIVKDEVIVGVISHRDKIAVRQR
jgi:hypothetical protein